MGETLGGLLFMGNNKFCVKCKKELPLTNDYFNKYKNSKDGFKPRCKTCQRDDAKEYYKKRGKEVNTKYRKDNIEKYENYKSRNKEALKVYSKKYREKNKEVYRTTVRISTAKWRSDPNVKSKCSKYNSEWKRNNLDSLTKYRHKRKALLMKAPNHLTTHQWSQIKLSFNCKCAYCGMAKKLTQDHFIPVDNGGEYTLNNIIPSCQSCNSSKKNRNFFKWYPSYRHYSKQRERKILEHLNYNNNIQQLSIL